MERGSAPFLFPCRNQQEALLDIEPGSTQSNSAPTHHPTDPDEELKYLRAELAPEIEVVRHIGSGSGSEVYLGRESALKRLVAIKVLSPKLSGDNVAMGRFEREARAAAALNHPNAIPVFRFGSLSSGVPFLIMYYVAGGTLEDRVAREGPLPIPEARRVLTQTASALAAAHKRGFVHRDIRTGNILCEKEQQRVLVGDFGLAGVIPGGDNDDPRLTRTGEILGLPPYTSPEQLQGKEATECSDIYALGVMGYEILTGDGPFPGASNRDLIISHLQRPPQPLQQLRPDVDPDLAQILEKCLEKDPKKRPTAEYLVRLLGQEGDREATAAGSSGEGNILSSLLHRRLPQVVVAAGAVGFGVEAFANNLADRGIIPEMAYRFILNTLVFGVLAAMVVGWHHGAKGKQRVPVIEIILLALIVVAWALVALFWVP